MHHGDKSDERFLFHRTGSILSDKSGSMGLLIMNATIAALMVLVAGMTVDVSAIFSTVRPGFLHILKV